MSRTVQAPALEASAERCVLGSGEPGLCLKVVSFAVEVNVWLPSHAAEVLASLPARDQLALGASAGAPAYWSRDSEGNYYLLIGADSETWDVGLTFDRVAFERIVLAIKEPSG